MPAQEPPTTSPTLSHDPDVNALYIQLSDADVQETLELAKGVYVDVDSDGQVVGFEVLHADAALLASIPTVPNTAELRDLLKPDAA